MLQQHELFNDELGLLEINSKSADKTLSDVYQKLESHLKTCKITSTASSAASIVGVNLLFTPSSLSERLSPVLVQLIGSHDCCSDFLCQG